MIISILSLLAWGGLNNNWLAAAVMAILILSPLVNTWRWSLKIEQFYRIGDFVTALFVVAILFLWIINTAQRPVFIILEWLPLFFLPIMLVQLYSAEGRLPIGVLLYSRRRREEISRIDFNLSYALICLLAAGTMHDGSLWYWMASIAIISKILWSVRSKNSPVFLWLGVMALAISLSFFAQQRLSELQATVEDLAIDWLSDWETDPFRSMTSIGDIGDLKLSNKIEFRVKASEPQLLLQSSYDRYLGQSWLASERVFTEQAIFLADKDPSEHKQLQVFQSRKRSTVLALPAGTFAIKGLEGGVLQFTPLGAVKLTDAPDYVNYKALYTGQLISKASKFDLQVPKQHLSWITKIKQELNLDNKSPQIIAASIQHFFQTQYYYSLFLGRESNADKALEEFMLQRKAGHCEYFAVASTLLLRSYGIPARLANGYAMQEYSAFEKVYIVRRRHAHAWAIAQIEGVWQAVDSTPAQWLALEEEQVSLFQPVYDLFSMLYFQFKQWRYEDALQSNENDKSSVWLSIAVVLFLILIARLYKARKQLLKIKAKKSQAREFNNAGLDSELYQLEKVLIATEKARLENESMLQWVARIQDKKLQRIAELHYQYRFDNTQFSEPLRSELTRMVKSYLLLNK